jgi:ankyrin repeat protein
MRRLRLIGLLLLVPMLVAGTWLGFITYSRFRPQPPSRVYEVRYSWDDGVKWIDIINAKTGKRERNPLWRELATRDAKKVLPDLVKRSGLRRAKGRFLIDFWDFDQPFLGRCRGDQEVFTDPDVTPLMVALRDGDDVKARRLVAAGTEVNAADQSGWTALMGGARSADPTTARMLLAAGANVNARDNDGDTPLFVAVFNRNVATASELINHGGDVNAISKYGGTPLGQAAESCQLALVKLLLERGAEVNRLAFKGNTPLMWASRSNCAGAVQLLIAAGADVNAKTAEGESALGFAESSEYQSVMRLLKHAGAKK